MVATQFQALVLEKGESGVHSSVQKLDEDSLPKGDVTVAVSHSTLNYKDGLILTGLGRLVKTYPHIPGIDLSGTVETSKNSDYIVGDQVVLTGWRVGESHWGGFAQKARVDPNWLVPMPENLSPKKAMAIGTAGFTAMLAFMALEDHGMKPDKGPVLVTGANGGVGGIAIAILKVNGYEVHAVTGRMKLSARLKAMGADKIIERSEMMIEPKRPLQSEYWAGCIDAVGGKMLANVLTQIKHGGCVAACGLAGGAGLSTTLTPFLLRGVSLLGVDSVMCPIRRRKEAWARLAKDIPSQAVSNIAQIVGLEDLPDLADKILAGQIAGRIVVDLNR